MSDLDQALSVARLQLKAERLDEVAAIHHLLTALRPDDAEGWYRLGHALGELGRDAAAGACFRETLRLSPGHAGAAQEIARAVELRLERAQAAETAGRRVEAICLLGEAAILNPEDSRLQRALLRHAVAAMPEATEMPSVAGEADAYRFWLLRRELALGRAALDAGDTAGAQTRFSRVAAVATDAEAEMRRIGVAGQAMTRPRSPLASTADRAQPLIAEAERLAADQRVEEALACLRRALPLVEDLDTARALLRTLKSRLTAPGSRLMPGIGPVELRVEGEVWRYLPEKPKASALVISVPHLPALDQDDPALDNHGPWEVRQVARSLLAAGIAIDVTHFRDARLPATVPDYDLAYSLHGALAAIAGRLPARTLKVLWLTGSSPDYQNRRERERIAALAARGRTGYAPNRQVDVATELKAMDLADRCVILGNEHTLSTFQPAHRAKMVRLMPTASRLLPLPPISPRSEPPEFLWLGGGGAVLKGLDLVLEAFAAMPDLTLHVVGFPAEEPDFERLYEHELYRLPNIRLHGFLRTSGPEFAAILARTSALLAPSASEGAATSVATCLVAGLFPIVSDDTGLDYDEALAIHLHEPTVEGIIQAARNLAGMPPARLAALRRALQAKAAALFSRERFARDLDAQVQDWIRTTR